MDAILRDVKYALRQFRKSPGFALVAVLMLAVGIAATTTTFSIVEGVLLRPLPFRDPERLVALGDRLRGTDIGDVAVTAPEILTYTRDTHTFETLGAYEPIAYELSGI